MKHLPARALGTWLVLVSALGSGLLPVLVRSAYAAGLSPLPIAFWRFGLASIVLWLVVAVRRPALPSRRLAAQALGLGAVCYAGQAVLYLLGVAHVGGTLTGLMVYTYPALVVLAGTVLGRTRPSRSTWGALAVSLGGALLVMLAGGSVAPLGLGVLFGLGAAVVLTVYVLALEGLGRIDPVVYAALAATGAAGTTGLGALVTGTAALPPAPAWASLAAVAVISTAAPAATFALGMRLVGSARAALLSCTELAVGCGASALICGDRMSLGQLLGGALIAGAAVLVAVRRATPVPEAVVPISPVAELLPGQRGTTLADELDQDLEALQTELDRQSELDRQAELERKADRLAADGDLSASPA